MMKCENLPWSCIILVHHVYDLLLQHYFTKVYIFFLF